MQRLARWVQGYDGQAIVNPHQIVLACDVSQDTGDVQLYQPMTTTLNQTLAAAGVQSEIDLILADAGYCSEANLTCPGPDRLIGTQKDHKQRRAARELGHTSGPPPPDATPVEEMEHLLRTPQGAAAYKQRSNLIEPVFGDRKHNRAIRRFRRRGINAVRSEWAFIQLAGNLLKLHHHHAATATPDATTPDRKPPRRNRDAPARADHALPTPTNHPHDQTRQHRHHQRQSLRKVLRQPPLQRNRPAVPLDLHPRRPRQRPRPPRRTRPDRARRLTTTELTASST